MKDYGIYEKVKLNGIVPGRLIRHTFFSTGRDLRYRGYDTNQLRFSKKSDSRL